MSGLRNMVRRVTKSPGVPQARHLAERSVAPYLRADVHQLAIDHEENHHRITELQLRVEELARALGEIEGTQPQVLNAVASTGGTARTLARAIETGDAAIRAEMRPHIDAIAHVMRRVETIRMEMMHEARYGQRSATAESIEARVINADKIVAGEIRLNIGAGHITPPEYINVDMRELPGIDVVAAVDNLPFAAGSVKEIFSSHVMEHFPDQQMRRALLPYWVDLLEPGGTFRAIVPDFEAMTLAYAAGEMTFGALREVTYGSQEYDGDFHFNGFTPDTFSALLTSSGLVDPTVIASARPNGLCLEFEIAATRPRT
ncbi:MAG: hypothetical protein JWM47_4198 [Acidimicrobiales bacterium]|nr:hypothetical protein [Acidimicrobiales bacterium]